MAFVSVNGTRLAYDEAGAGPAVVLVHGDLADRRTWDDQFDALATDHRTVRYDRRGHGDSETPVEPFSHHQDLLGLMKALEIEEAVLIGNSGGGGHAVEAALAAPDRVAGLVLACAGVPGLPWPDSFIEQARARVGSTVPDERRARYRSGGGADMPELEADLDAYATAHIRWMVAGPDRTEHDLPQEAWDLSVAMFRDRLRREWTEPQHAGTLPERPAHERLGEVLAPTLVVNGQSDVPEIQEVSRLLGSRVPNARIVELPATGHAPQLERPAEFTALVRGFLGEIEAR
ncbi:alpha/beta fold hydrolase [Glycomyces tenuis]|uniref:alpha/beta fold hydrolase n=1 Tax=Glycomyces tenuis TaxID=58116 RepID=UPI000478DB2C|nr:alpha/beta hydrolase [Glycomyces tenuis]